jgi:hypothetical protein
LKLSNKKLANQAIKIALLALAVFLLGQRLVDQSFENVKFLANGQQWFWATLTFSILYFLNISLDALNWQIVQGLLRQISLKEAFVHNLKCYALAFLTPANSGELAARYLVQTEKEHRAKAFFLTTWVHLPKSFAKLSLALPLSLYLLGTLGYQTYLPWAISLGLGLSWLAYFNLEKVLSYFDDKHWRGKSLGKYLVKGRPNRPEKLKLLLLNAIRFACFSGQMALVLYVLNPQLISFEILASLPVYYFLGALIPTWAAFDFLIKSVLSLYFFTLFSNQEMLFAVAATLVWVFNIALPALVGLLKFNPAELHRLKPKRG